ncbi:uncharacterized protein LY89DRAFT_63037 [Mollisia scopiformis]|uniref:DUF7730 domain-containing protein n=1 Tax=Mollisia scopiformis TaxID=149040 RepID=A0A194X947_MOLSC|nr:uncharacterized protein LY89DRAFT_63037 [Mollisia scopiformis]KUJ16701.1 hypothetical protein LY89DRAFT_63037 [Mollisia scopiformis]
MSIGNTTFHIQLQEGRLRGVMCTSLTPHLCNGCGIGRACRVQDTLSPVTTKTYNALAVLQTCHVIYFETIAILYSQNTFVVWQSDCIEFMPRLFLPQRIDSIRLLRFTWTYLGDPPLQADHNIKDRRVRFRNTLWTMVWRNISRMAGLQDLRVTLRVSGIHWSSLPPENAAATIEPIKNITGPKIFQLIVPDDIGAEKAPWTKLPCVIKTVPSATQYSNPQL